MQLPEIGSWRYSNPHRELVRVLEAQSLWGHTTCQVWAPSRSLIEWVEAEALSEPPVDPDHLLDQITYKACAVAIADALTQNVLLAPLEAGVIPLPHQLQALSRAVSRSQVRYLLADEVGLGKTIEAGLILRELKLRGLVKRVLVVAPRGLMSQWASEMQTHFAEDFRVVSPAELSGFQDFLSGDNLWAQFDQVICPLDAIKPIDQRKGWTKEKLDQHNQQRLGDLVAAGWDLIIVDEAHRLGGSTETVARYKLGKSLAEAAPYLLLLSATPHQGKTDAFQRLVSLLDKDAFPDPASICREKVAPFVLRTEKRRAIDDRGEPLFQPRTTRLVTVSWEARHAQQKELYEAVTEYVREGYNQALRENRQYLGFVMLLMQRLMTSSTRAIATALARRIEVLKTRDGSVGEEEEAASDWYEQDGQERLESLLDGVRWGSGNERDQVRLLLELAQRCQAQGPDARAEALLDLLYTLQGEENDPELKFLVFTEFVPTQEMLAEFLQVHGYSVATLNGSMSLRERQQAQRRFSEDVRVLVSTDAGGEGLNLQFAHVVINYDLPWNPMRVEQRIGRVDRIGQEHPVRALNLLFEDSVELRVQEVLQEKLLTIYDQFGVDKTGDVLDSEEAGAYFEQAVARAIADPDKLEESVEEVVARVRERAQAETQGRSMYATEELDPGVAARIREHPIQYWVERMVTSYLRANGGRAERKLLGWDLTLTDGTKLENVTFVGRDAVGLGLQHLGFQDRRLHQLIERVPPLLASEAVPVVHIAGLPAGLSGYWGLWQVGLLTGGRHQVRALPLFCHDDGRVLLPTARLIWEKLVDGHSAVSLLSVSEGRPETSVLDRMRAHAEEHGYSLFSGLEQQHLQTLDWEKDKGDYAYRVRQEALNRIGLPEVRRYRLRRLAEEEKQWRDRLDANRAVFPELQPMVYLRVVSEIG